MNDSAALIIAEALNNVATAINNLNKPKATKKSKTYEEQGRERTASQKLVEVWKQKIIEIPEPDQKSWDKVNFARNIKSAHALLDIFKCTNESTNLELEPIVECMDEIYQKMKKANLGCTLETVAKHAHEWRQENGYTNITN